MNERERERERFNCKMMCVHTYTTDNKANMNIGEEQRRSAEVVVKREKRHTMLEI